MRRAISIPKYNEHDDDVYDALVRELEHGVSPWGEPRAYDSSLLRLDYLQVPA